jgi:leucyl-tRNA synthetase
VPFEPIPIIEIPVLGNMAAKKCYEDLKIQSHKDTDKLKQAKDMCYMEGFYKGIMMVGNCSGKKVEEAKPIVKAQLIAENMAVTYYEPEGEVVSRSGDQCIVALKFQWLMNYGEENWKKDVNSHIQSEHFNSFNPKIKHEFEVILDWLKEWGCSRTAGLGTNLPWDDTFIVESLSDSTIYMAYYTVAHLLQGGVLDGSVTGPLGVKAEDMNMAAWDYVFLGKEYNASECPNVSEDQLKKMRHEFEYWYPMDLRVSAKDLIRNHLTMSLYNHAAIWKENMEQRMCRGYFCNGYLMLNNMKMSKSTGNFMTMKECINFYGIDASRIALADAGDSLDDANFDEKVANTAISRLFVMEEWIQKHCPKEIDFAGVNTKHDGEWSWDRIMESEMTRITAIVN